MATRKSKRFFGMALILCLALFVASEKTAGDITARAQGDLQAQTELGARLYAENCAICHGPNGEGRVGATLAKNWPSIRPDLTVKTIIVNGVPGTAMPAWGQEKGGPLNGEEIDALVSYILSWQTSGQRISAAPFESSNNATRQAFWYIINVTCQDPSTHIN